MNKADLIAAIAAKTGDTKKVAEASVNAFVDVVTETLKKGDKVQLVGFGSFEVRKRAARKGRNPQTKEEIKIPASKAPVFKAGKASGVTGRPHRLHHNGQCVFVAIGSYGNNILIVSAGFALSPQLLTGSAEKAGLFFLYGDFQAFTVHIGKCQHPFGHRIHHNGRNQSFFIKFQLIYIHHDFYHLLFDYPQILTWIPFWASSFFRSFNRTSPKWKTEAARPASTPGTA